MPVLASGPSPFGFLQDDSYNDLPSFKSMSLAEIDRYLEAIKQYNSNPETGVALFKDVTVPEGFPGLKQLQLVRYSPQAQDLSEDFGNLHISPGAFFRMR